MFKSTKELSQESLLEVITSPLHSVRLLTLNLAVTDSCRMEVYLSTRLHEFIVHRPIFSRSFLEYQEEVDLREETFTVPGYLEEAFFWARFDDILDRLQVSRKERNVKVARAIVDDVVGAQDQCTHASSYNLMAMVTQPLLNR